MKRLVLFFCMLPAFALQGEGADSVHPDPKAMRIEALVREALDHNPELKAYQADVAAARGDRTQAGLWSNPELAIEYGERRVKDPGGPLQGDGRTRSIVVMQPFEFPGKGSLRKAIAERNIEIAELGLKQYELALKGKVRQLAYRLAAARRNLEIAREVNDYADAQIELLRTRAAAGIQGMLDLRMIEASRMEIKVALAEMEQSSRDASTELNSLLGRPANSPLGLDVKLKPPFRRFDPTELVRAGLNHNFQLLAHEADLKRADSELSAARLDAAPDFSVGPFYSQDKAADNEVNFGIAFAMTIPLWDWNQGNIESANARRSRAHSMTDSARLRLEAEIIRRFHAYQLAQKRLSQFDEGFLEKMHDSADLADRHYRLGSVNVVTFMETLKQYLKAGQFYGDAIVTAHESLFDLELLTGGGAGEAP